MAEAHRIKSEQEALEAARRIAEEIRPSQEIVTRIDGCHSRRSNGFLRAVSGESRCRKNMEVPGSLLPFSVRLLPSFLKQTASLGQIPQNHYANVEEIRLIGTKAQKAFFFDRILKGERLGNAAVERAGKTVLENQTKLVIDGDGYLLSGEKYY